MENAVTCFPSACCVCASEEQVSSGTGPHCCANVPVQLPGHHWLLSNHLGLECGQNKFLPASKHSVGIPILLDLCSLSLAQEGGFKPPRKLWKAAAECAAVTFSKLFHSSIDFLTLVASASRLWGKGRMPASQNYKILKRLNQSRIFITTL